MEVIQDGCVMNDDVEQKQEQFIVFRSISYKHLVRAIVCHKFRSVFHSFFDSLAFSIATVSLTKVRTVGSSSCRFTHLV